MNHVRGAPASRRCGQPLVWGLKEGPVAPGPGSECRPQDGVWERRRTGGWHARPPCVSLLPSSSARRTPPSSEDRVGSGAGRGRPRREEAREGERTGLFWTGPPAASEGGLLAPPPCTPLLTLHVTLGLHRKCRGTCSGSTAERHSTGKNRFFNVSYKTSTTVSYYLCSILSVLKRLCLSLLQSYSDNRPAVLCHQRKLNDDDRAALACTVTFKGP